MCHIGDEVRCIELSNEKVIKCLEEDGESYKYLGVLETDKKVKKEYYRIRKN